MFAFGETWLTGTGTSNSGSYVYSRRALLFQLLLDDLENDSKLFLSNCF